MDKYLKFLEVQKLMVESCPKLSQTSFSGVVYCEVSDNNATITLKEKNGTSCDIDIFGRQ